MSVSRNFMRVEDRNRAWLILRKANFIKNVLFELTVNFFFLPYLRPTVKIFQFLRLSTKFLDVLRLSVNPIKTLVYTASSKFSQIQLV